MARTDEGPGVPGGPVDAGPGASSAATQHRARWPLVVLAGAVVAVVLVVVFITWWSAMTPDGARGDGRPQPGDARVVAARQAATPRTAAVLREALDGPVASTLPATALAAAQTSSCLEGQHNWKVQNDVDLTCTLTDAVLVDGGALATFGDDMTALHDAFLAAEWTATGTQDLPALLTGYWDDRERILRDNPGFAYPADMPGAEYAGPDGATVTIGWEQQRPGADAGTPEVPRIAWTAPDGSAVTDDDLAAMVPDGRYALVVTTSHTYFAE